MIRVACPHCQRTFRTTTEAMGVTAVCSGCHQSFRIGEARPPFTWKPTSLAEDSWIGVEPPEEKKEIKHCIICDAPLGDDAIRCLACGANQITGLVHKPRNRPVQDVKAPFWALLPIKPLIVVAVVAAIGMGVFVAIKSMFKAAVDDGLEMAQVRMIRKAAQDLANGMDPDDFAVTHAGRVTDKNLPRALEMLNAGDAMIRAAAAPLIACGKITQVQPIVDKAKSTDAALASGAIQILQALGPRRLVELSVDDQAEVRRPAAEALCLLFKIPLDDRTLEMLSSADAPARRIDQLNRLCRAWPRAVGTFSLVMGEEVAPLPAVIEQIGRTFYLQIGTGRFVSEFDTERTFVIPVEKWCAATGVAVDPKEVRSWISGTLTLASPYGAGWEGELRVQALRKLASAPPGFLPVGELDGNETVVMPVVLQQR
ncbi:MAG TPA: hypothetical protein PL151_00815 [Phycisphaerae bacterium]|nr:hypothetical protein [Phycisphaerae bacterium]HOJ72600.1 hypothetical protein [Phycisphaerae bacterium]HOM49739.1 hypothetical protein [Phycisphaerae bacterium]HON64969.1 hypothetical protein [Phycisphaerae bacterium]HOQ84816.1 hypothetical protein [Phycisphaerae bacterium]